MFTGRFYVFVCSVWTPIEMQVWSGVFRGLHHYGTQVVSGFEDGQNAFNDANDTWNKRPAENQIQQAHPKTPCAEFVYAKRAKQ